MVGLRFFPAAWSFKISVQNKKKTVQSNWPNLSMCDSQTLAFLNHALSPCLNGAPARPSVPNEVAILVHPFSPFHPHLRVIPTTFHQRFDLWSPLTCLLVSGSLLTYQDFALNQTLCFRNCSQFSGHVSFCSEEDCGASKCIAYHLPNDLRMNQKLPHLDIGTGDPWCHSQ